METKTYNPYHTDNIPKDPKEFAMYAIAPYFKDPSVCGVYNGGCAYITSENKMCVAGRFMKPVVREKVKNSTSINNILSNTKGGQSEIFIPEAVNILTHRQWARLQLIHDGIAYRHISGIVDNVYIKILGLFTKEELEEYCKTH